MLQILLPENFPEGNYNVTICGVRILHSHVISNVKWRQKASSHVQKAMSRPGCSGQFIHPGPCCSIYYQDSIIGKHILFKKNKNMNKSWL